MRPGPARPSAAPPGAASRPRSTCARRGRAEGHGRPITAVPTGGERHEQIALEAVLDRGAIRRPGRGRPRPRRVAGDRGYGSPTARRRVRRRGIIPTKKDQPRRPDFDRAAYRQRNKVERPINRLKQVRRSATRYEKQAVNDLAMLTIGMSRLWLRASQTGSSTTLPASAWLGVPAVTLLATEACDGWVTGRGLGG